MHVNSIWVQILEVVAETGAPSVSYEDLLRNFGTGTAVGATEPQEAAQVRNVSN